MARRIVLWATGLVVLVGLPLVMPNGYYEQVLVTAVLYCIAALGLNFIYGFTGYISFAQAAFFGIGSYVTALLSVNYHWPPLLTYVAVIAISAIFGVLLGIPSLRLKGHYLAMVSIGFTIVLQMVLMNWTPVTNGAQGINNIPAVKIGPWDTSQPSSFYYLAAFVLCALWFLQRNILHSKMGRSFLAIREDEIAASSAGVNLIRTKVWAFVWSAIYAGLAGALYAQFSSYISPDTYSFEQSVTFFTMTLVGGAGTLAGPIVGGFLLTFLPELLRFMKEYYMAVYGLGIVFVVIFMPQGIVPVMQSLWKRIRNSMRAKPVQPLYNANTGNGPKEEVIK